MRKNYSQLCVGLVMIVLLAVLGCDSVRFEVKKPAKKQRVVYQDPVTKKETEKAYIIVPPKVVVERETKEKETIITGGNSGFTTGDGNGNTGVGGDSAVFLEFNITDVDQPKMKIVPDLVRLGDEKVTEGDYVNPGTYSLYIEKEGYFPVRRSEIEIEEGIGRYVLSYQMKKKPAEVPQPTPEAPTILKWNIQSEYGNEPIERPEAVLVDGTRVSYGSEIEPGNHTIEVRQPAHEIYTQTVEVPEVDVFEFEATLITLPRRIKVTIAYDVPPPANLGETRASLTSNATGTVYNIDPNLKLKPGVYTLKVEKRGYKTIDQTLRIYPATSPYEIDVTMEAKTVVVNAQIDFDIPPPGNLDPHVITFITDTGSRQQIRPGGRIKPGSYSYVVEKPGYRMQGGEKGIIIQPSEDEFFIQEKMVAKNRRISFDVRDGNILIRPKSIYVNGQKVSFQDTFKPGQRYSMVAEFDRYQTVEQKILIPPGEGPYVLQVSLTPK